MDPAQNAAEPPVPAPGLYLVATPIGNLGDMSPRAVETLEGCDRVLCEDTRHSGRLLVHFGIDRPLQRFDDHTSPATIDGLVAELAGGARLALVSDAGTPAISDPGFELVRGARAEGVAIHAVPGPSAVTLALVLSGLPSDRFTFIGFVPRKGSARREWLEEVAQAVATQVCFDSPRRLATTLEEIGTAVGSRRTVAVCRELTKLHEEVRTGTARELAAHYDAHPPKGEVTLVIAGTGRKPSPHVGEAQLELLRALTGSGSLPPRKAAKLAAAATGCPANALYEALNRDG